MNSLLKFLFPLFHSYPYDHGVRCSVAATANFKIEQCPNTLGASSSSAWEQCPCFFVPPASTLNTAILTNSGAFFFASRS